MDANGTRFHLLLGEGDWGRTTPGALEWARSTDEPIATLAELWDRSAEVAELTGLGWSADRGELTLAPQLFQFPPSATDRAPSLDDRRGAARDRYGNWYWIGVDEREILVNSSGSGATTHFWSAADGSHRDRGAPAFGGFAPTTPPPSPDPLRVRGLAITEDHYLVVGALEPAGLLVFDLHAGGGPVCMVWPAALDFTPFDVVARPGGGVFVLDRDPLDEAKGTRYWALDRRLEVVAQGQPTVDLDAGVVDPFVPVDGAPPARRPRTFPIGVTLDLASPVVALDAIAIEALPDGSVVLLDRDEPSGFSKIRRYGMDGEIGEPVSTEVMRNLVPDAARDDFRLVAHDFAFVAEHESHGATVPDRIFVVEEKGNQSFAFDLHAAAGGQLRLEPLQLYLPMRLFGGKALATGADDAWYDFEDRWIPLVEQPRPRYETSATLETPVFDGREPACVWHRLMLDADIAAEARVEVWTRAADDRRDLAIAGWRQEPPLYRRGDGSELPFVVDARHATWELLFQRARGRYLQVKLRLTGNGRTTPRLRALRAYYPRFSYLEHYLPAVYREDEPSASFLDRFLANVEGTFTAIEDRIAAVELLFDQRSAPSEHLDWLAGWFGVALDPSWCDAKRRLFIRHAMHFFQYRGTIHGVKSALRLALERCADESVFDLSRSADYRRDSIRIVEGYRTRRTPGVVLGDSTSVGGSQSTGLPSVDVGPRWTPANGRSDLDSRFRDYLASTLAEGVSPIVPFRLRSYDWQRVESQGSVAPRPLAEPSDTALWRAFLERRYVTIQALNATYGTGFASFAAVTIPESVDAATAPLADWNDLVAAKSAAWREFAARALGFVPRALGRERDRWTAFLRSRYATLGALRAVYGATIDRVEDVALPVDAPAIQARRADWDDHLRATAGTAPARARWQNYLARRYRRIAALNGVWGTAWTGFDDVSLLDELPLGETALADWHRFESVVLAIQAAAHRFTVLLPAPADRTYEELARRRDLATRIVEWEKPAHTTFDVKFYWSMFRVGAARLGYDTLLDAGSRAPELLRPMVLGQGYLAESYVADPRDLGGRTIVGRDQLAGSVRART